MTDLTSPPKRRMAWLSGCVILLISFAPEDLWMKNLRPDSIVQSIHRIVAAITGYLAKSRGYISDRSQFDDRTDRKCHGCEIAPDVFFGHASLRRERRADLPASAGRRRLDRAWCHGNRRGVQSRSDTPDRGTFCLVGDVAFRRVREGLECHHARPRGIGPMTTLR